MTGGEDRQLPDSLSIHCDAPPIDLRTGRFARRRRFSGLRQGRADLLLVERLDPAVADDRSRELGLVGKNRPAPANDMLVTERRGGPAVR